MDGRRARREKGLGPSSDARADQGRKEAGKLRARKEEPAVGRPGNPRRVRADPGDVGDEALVRGLAFARVAQLDQRREGLDFALRRDLALAEALQLRLEAAQLALDLAQVVLEAVTFGLERAEVDGHFGSSKASLVTDPLPPSKGARFLGPTSPDPRQIV